MLIMNQNMIVDTFALKGKKTKSAFSNNTLVIQRIETRNRYDLWRFQVHNDESPDEIENFLKRIKTVTTFLTIEDSQFLPIGTYTDSSVYDSASLSHINESFSCDNEFKVPEAASLDWNIKQPIQNQRDSFESDSTMGNSISLLRNLKIEEVPQFRASHAGVLPPIVKGLKTNHGVVQPQNQEGSFGAFSHAMSYPVGGSGTVDSPYEQMLTPIIEDRSFDTRNRNIPSRIARPFEIKSSILPCSVGGKTQLNPNNETMTTQFGGRLFNTAHGSIKPQTGETHQFNKVYRDIPIPRRPFIATDRDIPSLTPNKRPFETEKNRTVLSHSIGGGMYFQSRKLEENFKTRITPHQFGGRKFPSHSVGKIIPTINNHETIPTQFMDKSQFPATNANTSRLMIASKENSSITGRPLLHVNVQPSVIKKGRVTNENIYRTNSGRQVLKATNETLPYPTGRKLPNSINHFMQSKAIGDNEQLNTTGVDLLSPARSSTNIFKPSTMSEEEKQVKATKVHLQSVENGSTHWNLASSIAADRPLLANEVGQDKSSDGVTHMNVDADEENDNMMSMENEPATQGSQFIQTFSLQRVDAQACIAEPLLLGTLLIRNVFEPIPESSLTVLNDPKYYEHFTALEEAMAAGTDFSEIPSARIVAREFVRSDEFITCIEGIKSYLNDKE